MKPDVSLFSTGLFMLAIFCFFLPFMDISCNNTRIAHLTGKDLITGTDINQSGTNDSFNNLFNNEDSLSLDKDEKSLTGNDNGRIDPNGWIIAGFTAAVLGLLAGIFIVRTKKQIQLLLALTGMISLIGFQVQANNRFNQESNSELFKMEMHADYLIGYWLTLIIFGLISGISLSGLFTGKKVSDTAAENTRPPDNIQT